MQFNEEKFELLRWNPNENIKNSSNLHNEEGQKIVSKQQVKCLGVHVDEEATFHHLIKVTAKKDKGMAGWVLKIFNSRDKEVMLTLKSPGEAHTRLLQPSLVPSQKE